MKTKRFLLVLMLLALCMPASAREDTGTLRIMFFKAGKADAFLIRTGTHAVLLDAGETDDAEDILKYMAKQDIAKLDMLILTHFDQGHAGGAAEILDSVRVDKVVMAQYHKKSKTVTALEAALARNTPQQEYITAATHFLLDDVSFSLYPAAKDFYAEDEDDDFSIVTQLVHGENTFLFTGDIGHERTAEILMQGIDLRSHFLQVPAHGRFNANTERFLLQVAPQIAIITCSDKNPPSPRVLDILDSLGITPLLTRDGNITLTSDGAGISTKQ